MLEKITDNVMFRLVVYYAAIISIIFGLFNMFPQIPYHLAQERSHQARASSSELGAGVSAPLDTRVEGLEGLLDPATSIPVLMALVLSFALTLPVAWVYRWTHNKKKYAQTFAHTLLVLPIAIAGVVFLVKGSLALAFSLAGIVAAVRFRTTLNEPMDGVFVFIVAGIGLAAGVQLLNVAFISSMFFNAVAIAVWYTDFGAKPAVMIGCNVCTLDEKGARVNGNAQPVAPVAAPVAEKPHAAEFHDGKSFNAQLLVHTTKPERSEQTTIQVLESHGKRWLLDPTITKESGISILVFDVRLKKSVDRATLLGQIEKGDKHHITKVELKKYKVEKA